MKSPTILSRTAFLLAVAAILTLMPVNVDQQSGEADAKLLVDEMLLPEAVAGPSFVGVEQDADGSFRYLVNGSPQTFVGMGYNPIYRYLPADQRAASYRRDFRILREAGVNHLIGWDSDKGYEQDKFDELTLDVAFENGLGVMLPFYLPATGNYEDQNFRESLLRAAAAKVARFKDHPSLRMWGVGNEVLADMRSDQQRAPFLRFYPRIADLFHSLDPGHPVIYREAEDVFVPRLLAAWRDSGRERPWLLYGMNFYTFRLEQVLRLWPSYHTGRPLFVTEFGAEAYGSSTRADGYVAMWRMIRSHPNYVLGGAPYAWSTAGPEPTDLKWGLMDGNSRPVDDTFQRLAAEWRRQ